jgi:hypothetical protein
VDRQQYESIETIELRQADNDVAIEGWDKAVVELTLGGPEENCTVEQQGAVLLLECHVPLTLQVPRSTTVNVGQVSGDLLLKGLDRAVSVKTVHGDLFVGTGNASLSIETAYSDLGVEHLQGPLSALQVHGDVHMKDVSSARLGSVHGDVHARDVAAELEMGSVSGSIRLRHVAGQVTLEEGRGDFRGRDLLGGLTAHQVHGSLSLKTALTAGLTYSARAMGNISARFPPDTNARFTLSARGDLSAPLPEISEEESGRVVGQAGTGEAEVVLDAHGALKVRIRDADEEQPWGFSLESLGAEIEEQIASGLATAMEGLDHSEIASREIEKAMRQVEREIDKAQRNAERAAERARDSARRAEERARKAQEKALERAKKLQAKVERRWTSRESSRRPSRARPAHKGPSGDERMAVLNMLQAGKISTEDAERLLKALGD